MEVNRYLLRADATDDDLQEEAESEDAGVLEEPVTEEVNEECK
jgi:hypothetical protein